MKTSSRKKLKRRAGLRPRAPTLREVSREAQRRLVLDVAAKLLVEQGISAINMRSLGAAVGASSTIVYTLFGGRDQLLRAIFDDALAKMEDEFARVDEGAPFVRLVALAVAYRRFGLANPHFLHAITTPPGPLAKAAAAQVRDSLAFRILVDAVQRCIDAGVFEAGDVNGLADMFWSTVHGVVSLEVAGYFPDAAAAEEAFWRVGRTLLGALRKN